MLSDNWIAANLRGVDTHGVANLPKLVTRIKNQTVIPGAPFAVVKNLGAISVVDGGYGLGQVVGKKAMNLAMSMADKFGVGVVVIRKVDTLGMLAYYSMLALSQHMIGIVMCNVHAGMAPFGGYDPVIGNSPISIAIPAGKERPIVLDMATSVVAKRKIVHAQMGGRRIPQGWALTADGHETTDPTEALKGALLPIGGYKGYGLAVVIQGIAGALSGSTCDKAAVSYGMSDTVRPNVGQFLMALDIESFEPVAEFESRVDSMIGDIKRSRILPGTKAIMLPGEPEFLLAEQRERQGIPIDEEVWNRIVSCFEDLGVSTK